MSGLNNSPYLTRILPYLVEYLELRRPQLLKARPSSQNSCDSPSTNPPRTMISRSAIGPKAQLALRRQCCAHPANRRGFAASISGSTSFSYETADVNGVKVASRDVAGPTTKLAVVAKAGTRYQSAPGLTSGLEQFAFKVGGQTQCTVFILDQRLTPSSSSSSEYT